MWTWEIDPHFVGVLKTSTSARIIEGDFARARVPDRAFQVVGNIPYSATSRIVDWCLAARGMRSATLMTQLQYALKRTGGYGRWSQLTALSWPTHGWTFHGRVPSAAFNPVPRVDSGILRIDRHERPLLSAPERHSHDRAVRCAFHGAGGSVGASLGAEFGRVAAAHALASAGVSPRSLAATVHPDSWIVVARQIAKGR